MAEISKKTAVIYKSKTGLTEQYACWIAEELNAQLFQLQDLENPTLQSFRLVVYGGGLYAGVINGLHQLKSRLSKEIPQRRLIVFATGASPATPAQLATTRNGNFSRAEQEKVPFFYYQAGIDYERMNGGDRFLMALFNGLHQLVRLFKGKGKGPAPKPVSANLCDRADIAALVAQSRKWKP